MSAQPTDQIGRRFEFVPTEAVARSRANARFISCPACGADAERYLFHERGARFVQCRSCDVVYVNPPAREVRDYFDVRSASGDATIEDREHVRKELDDVLRYATEVHRVHRGRSPARVLVAGRMADDVGDASSAHIDAVRLTRERDAPTRTRGGRFSDRRAPSTRPSRWSYSTSCWRRARVPRRWSAELAARLPNRALLVVVYSNAASLPGRMLRHNWRRFFHWKAVYFNSENLRSMLERAGLRLRRAIGPEHVVHADPRARPDPSGHHGGRRRPARRPRRRRACACRRGRTCRSSSAPRSRRRASCCRSSCPCSTRPTYLRAVLDELLGKQFVIPHEVIVVESNSTDGTREIAQTFEGRPGLQIIYEDRPRGKGAAVRRGLAAATGTIVLIQDADFEYDLDDYDALLEPIVQRRTSFVLGSRSLGLDDWKVRRFARSRVKAFLMNVAQLLFARTFNVLYQQRVTDVNTMFKVFRRECIEGVEFAATGFSFDIELACMLVKNGYSPMEVPVNYVARGFDEGKKINFVSEFFPSFLMFFKCRFGLRGRA